MVTKSFVSLSEELKATSFPGSFLYFEKRKDPGNEVELKGERAQMTNSSLICYYKHPKSV